MFAPLIFILLFQLTHGQQLIYLNTLKGDNIENGINQTAPCSLFVSAQADADELLARIFVKTSDNLTMSLQDLKNAKEDENSGFLTPFSVTSTASLISNLTDEQLESLKGFIYVTSSEQANDKNFRVYDVDRFSIIETEHSGNYTLVFLSTNFETNPAHSSTISHWQQQNDSVVNIYRGIPGDRRRIYQWQLFSNPIVWDPQRGDSKM
ncbi:hypothetical protein CAEBREN_04329 [Caenorhabditis brenneri]|uniref:Uncharacterized protein n=1 Tax=Caenorhabditis brenneri TaxID=135651 RepID=G0M8W9_CAEBE|nr:hypothetical protein CAEBREN_04329 [Caenorhabditis brenneri]